MHKVSAPAAPRFISCCDGAHDRDQGQLRPCLLGKVAIGPGETERHLRKIAAEMV